MRISDWSSDVCSSDLDVHPHTGVAPRGGQGMHALVARRGRVALAVGDVFQDGRDGVLLGILRQPAESSQTASVRHSDEGIRNFGECPNRSGLQVPYLSVTTKRSAERRVEKMGV